MLVDQRFFEVFFCIVNFDQEIIHPGRIVSFTGEREHTFDDLFDYDWETKTTCWGSSAQCRIDCNRNGNTYTIWDRAYSFRQGNHQLTFTMVFFYENILNFMLTLLLFLMILIIQSHFDHVRCPYRMALAPGGLLYVIARSQFTYGSLDKDFSMVIVFSDMSPKKI